MRTLVLLVALASSLCAAVPTAHESPEHISISKNQIVLIEEGLFIAHDGTLFKASALFDTDAGWIAEIRGREQPTFERCTRCNLPKYTGVCENVGCPLCGQ